jgi:hypothetical protein
LLFERVLITLNVLLFAGYTQILELGMLHATSSEPAVTLNVYYDRDAQVCRKFFLGEPPNLKMLQKLPYIHHFNFFLHLDVPPNLFTKLVCRELKRLRTVHR